MLGTSFTRRVASVVGGLLALASGAITAELTHAAAPSAQRSQSTVSEGVAPTGVVADVADTTQGRPEMPALAPELSAEEAAPAPSELQPSEPQPPPFVVSADSVSSNLRGGRIMSGATAHRFILFTFDDGPDIRYTRRLLDALDDADIHAVFFLTTRRFEGTTPYERSLATIAREIAERGHRVGSHSMDHVQLPLVSSPDLATQIGGSATVIEREFGALPSLLRPPGGSRSARIDAYLASHGYTQMLWNLGTGDVQVRTASAVLDTFRRVLEVRERDHAERGGIVLLHDIHGWSVEAFPRIVAFLDRRNCDLMARGEELYDFVDDPAFFYEARREDDAPDTLAVSDIPADVLAARQVRARARAELRCEDTAALDARIAGR